MRVSLKDPHTRVECNNSHVITGKQFLGDRAGCAPRSA